MSNKPVANPDLHDGTAPNCLNHLAVVAFGHRPNADRTCPHAMCADVPTKPKRRRAIRKKSPEKKLLTEIFGGGKDA